MDCANVREQLELYVLCGLDDAAHQAVRAHLQRCPHCRAAEQQARTLVERIRHESDADRPRLDFARSLQGAVRAEVRRARGRRRWGRWAAVAASVAACVAVGLTLWLSLRAGEAPPAPQVPPVVHLWQCGHATAARMSAADGFVLHGEHLYVLVGDGAQRANVAAFDPRTGQRRWVSDVDARGYLAADERRVYCLASAGRRIELVALDAADGAVLWRFAQEGLARPLRLPTRPEVLGDGRLCWTAGGSVHLIRAADGTAIWSRPIAGASMLSVAAAAKGRLYVADAAALYELDPADGRIVATTPLPAEAPSALPPLLAVAGERIFIARGGAEGRLCCLRAADRRILWQKGTGQAFHLLADAGRLYVRGEEVTALDAATGETLWDFHSPGCGPVTLDGGLLYCVDSTEAGGLIALDGRTGARRWELGGYASCNAFVKAGSYGFLKTRDGVVHAMVFEG